MLQGVRPYLELLSDALVEKMVEEAYEILESVGILIDNPPVLAMLHDHGVAVDFDKKIARFPRDIVVKALQTVPQEVILHDREGNRKIQMHGKNIHFAPGSTAIFFLDEKTNEVRKPVTQDLVRFSQIVQNLEYIDAQSTALVCADVPEMLSDRYRVFLCWQHCSKPLVTGTFSVSGFDTIFKMLTVISGSEKTLKEKPIAILDCCPSSPLKWSDVTSQNLVDCARNGVPAELISMPLSGAVAPVTLAGSIVQHTAETLSGVVIHQLASPGSPLIYGGSPAIFDMRKGTTPMGAIETMMIDSAYNQIGKRLKMPTHGYLTLSDSKDVDMQAGLETGMGAMMAALSGINMISGPGMMDFESCQSIEKLVVDNEICGMAKRLVRGIVPREEKLALHLLQDIHEKEHLLTSPHTLQWMFEEHFMPSSIIDRSPRREEHAAKGLSMRERTLQEIERLEKIGGNPIDSDRQKELIAIMQADCRQHGFELPLAPR